MDYKHLYKKYKSKYLNAKALQNQIGAAEDIVESSQEEQYSDKEYIKNLYYFFGRLDRDPLTQDFAKEVVDFCLKMYEEGRIGQESLHELEDAIMNNFIKTVAFSYRIPENINEIAKLIYKLNSLEYGRWYA